MGASEQHNEELAWLQSFSEDQRQEQMDADSEAWNNIIGILLAIVAVGVSMAGCVVWAISTFTK
ncbi:MAG: hypothetical protein AAF497_07890 [Planctomycetota bacterium]